MPRKRKQPRDGGAWRKYALLAALIAALWARTPSAPARRLERQLERGRALFEAGNWLEAVAALDLRKHAAALRTDAERRAFWPRLHEAAAHRAQSALRAADLAATVEERRRGIEHAVKLFEAALAMDARAYTFLDFLYDSCRAYWRLGRAEAADALFEAAREKSEAFPWHTPRQMPCCGALARLPVANEKPWHAPHEYALTRILRDHAHDIRREFMNADLHRLVRASPEGHGAEFTRDATGRRPWRELVLYDGEKRGWDATTCASFTKTCALLRDAPSLITVPAAAPKPRYCCRVSVLRLAPGARVNFHTAPTNVRLKAHLVLSTPPGAFLSVAGERRNYSEDEVLVFDDSFFHAAENGHETEARFVLSVDFWKPGLLL
jgi:tetratricopeptide (TPR) repeat protein